MTIVEFYAARLDDREQELLPLLNSPRRNGKTHVRRELADIAAKRRIIERWEYRWREANDATEQHINSMFASQATGLGGALAFLAEVYSDHPDYREEWRP